MGSFILNNLDRISWDLGRNTFDGQALMSAKAEIERLRENEAFYNVLSGHEAEVTRRLREALVELFNKAEDEGWRGGFGPLMTKTENVLKGDDN